MAVNRRANCCVQVVDSGNWSISSQPSFWDANLTLAEMAQSPKNDLISSALSRISQMVNLTPHATLKMDTRTLFQFGKKMGLGSSAATIVSLYVAVLALCDEEYSIEGALRLHDDVYTSGSGIDVATCFSGGVIRFQERKVESISLPSGVRTKVFFVGTSTTTSDRVSLFQQWLSTQPDSTADRIKSASSEVADSVERADEFLESLRYFIEIQEFIDNGSRIGIWGPQHRAMKSLANRDGVLYKPSGAGGGDIGLALSTDVEALGHLSNKAERLGLKEIDAPIENSGVRVERVH